MSAFASINACSGKYKDYPWDKRRDDAQSRLLCRPWHFIYVFFDQCVLRFFRIQLYHSRPLFVCDVFTHVNLETIWYTTNNRMFSTALDIGRTLVCQAQLKPIQLKILTGVNIKMPAHFTVNGGFLVAMYGQVSQCIKSSV